MKSLSITAIISMLLILLMSSGAHADRVNTTTYALEFSVIPVAEADYMELNNLSNAAENGITVREMYRIDDSLVFGGDLPLFLNGGVSDFYSVQDIDIDFIDDSLAHGSFYLDEVTNIPPIIEISMTIETGFELTEGPDDWDAYTEANDFWPSDSRRVQRIIDDLLSNVRVRSDRDRVRIIHQWVRDNLEYGGGVVGSRWGTETVMRQGAGRCWDHSDVFITLARAAGIPSRQIAGWLVDFDSGHVWSQVWLEDEGIWLDVDATADSIGVDNQYIPIWGTRDGNMLFIYQDIPDIEIIRQ